VGGGPRKTTGWLHKAGLRLPRTFETPHDIRSLTIVTLSGAKGGRGYFLANSPEPFRQKAADMKQRGRLTDNDVKNVHLQEYVVGVNAYPHYFRSILDDEVEFLGVDKRYESAIDALGKIPASEQLQLDINPTYTIVGNILLTLRESLLPELLEMGDRVVAASTEIAAPGIVGPFCLETVVTDDLQIYTFEISARIVGGTNVGIGTLPYAYLQYGETMWMGKRIAREARRAIQHARLEDVAY